MVIVGGLLALLCGLINSAATALEKREMVRLPGSARGLRLLAVLARRALWLLAIALSVLGWAAEAAALGLAPVPLVTTLRTAGRGGLVAAGHRWLGERFGAVELAGVALVAVGAIVTASSVTPVRVAPPLADVVELAVAAGAVAVALVLARSSHGLVIAAAVGVLWAATGVFTKEIGDRIVREGAAGIPQLLATPGPWLMIAISIWAISLMQTALARANAATASAATTTVSATGLIVAAALLYRQPLAAPSQLPLLIAGLVLSAIGAVALVSSATRKRAAAIAPAGTAARPARRSTRSAARAEQRSTRSAARAEQRTPPSTAVVEAESKSFLTH